MERTPTVILGDFLFSEGPAAEGRTFLIIKQIEWKRYPRILRYHPSVLFKVRVPGIWLTELVFSETIEEGQEEPVRGTYAGEDCQMNGLLL